MDKSKLYFGGIPTEPDVKRLEKRFGAPAPGVIEHAEIEETIGQQRDSSRYRTVVAAWRRRLLREENIASAADPGVGIRILTEPERVDHAQRHLGLSAKRVVKEHRWAMMIDASKLDDVSRHKRDHVIRVSASMAAAASGGMKELSNALKAPLQLPHGTAPQSRNESRANRG